MTHERWIDVHTVERAQVHEGNGVLLRFHDHAHAVEFFESLCTGHELVDGGVRHDDGKYCPVHYTLT
jgi:hypothetical protein